ncbi:2-dehydropantoate 2-reductase [Isoptericola jiangsuensis]|uniref:2-dehydropantoate 2-reductase n=1 Tax=Isoptericola jiangsuensis TaxID=548579 RepID=A0A2A9EYP6_9MICO|nr:2-dehydropantoate 2-reductase N-terminal domain-containing protein [Isoptericola jiangsuensis]PFG43686.1 2-dehydropantoate 2-reductase [Isoptericola jiangsuensis]
MSAEHTVPPLAVVGPGAVGCLVAAFLHRAGADVVLVGRPRTVERLGAGLRVVTDRHGTWEAAVPATTAVPDGAVVLVAVKGDGLADVVGSVAQAAPVEVVSLLNGIEHMEALRAALPTTDVVGAAYAGETSRELGTDGPVVVRHRGELLRVTVPAPAQESWTARALRATDLPLVVGGSEAEVLWSKLRFLAPLALLTSVHHDGLGAALDADPGLIAALLAEVAAVATAEGVPSTGPELERILRGLPATMRSSLQADLEAGRSGELDAIGGAVARRGARHGLPTPRVDGVVARLAAEV